MSARGTGPHQRGRMVAGLLRVWGWDVRFVPGAGFWWTMPEGAEHEQ